MSKKEQINVEEGHIRIINPFGPSVGWAKIPASLVDKLNAYIDQIVEDKKKSSQLDHGRNLAGNVAQEFLLEKEFSKEIGWTDFLQKSATTWIHYSTEKKITKFELLSTWVVRQFQGEYNPIHWHSGHISGAGYLKVPKSFGEPVQKETKTYNSNGHIELIHGNRQFLSNAKLNIKPAVGNFYFFPHYMMHTVYPFADTEEERRSISFNARIDDSIYNVYGRS
tara:strand:+ start:589 stop:1257 length:669 start_codon:yes stop_codon:yes gene_type:complete